MKRVSLWTVLVLMVIGNAILGQERNIPIKSSFENIDASGVINIFISEGRKHSVTFDGDERLLEKFTFDVKNNTLVVKHEKNTKWKKLGKKADLFIVMPRIGDIDCSIVGKFIMEDELQGEEVDLDFSTVGNSELRIDCDELRADFSHVGNIDMYGSCERANIDFSAVGNLKASNFVTQELRIDHSGVGNVDVRAEREISMESSAVGNLRYSGKAKVVRKESSAIGKITRM